MLLVPVLSEQEAVVNFLFLGVKQPFLVEHVEEVEALRHLNKKSNHKIAS
jgi:hypothetical protein